jgi:RNase P subunit RPR2
MTPIITVGRNIKIIHERNILLKIVEDEHLNALLNENAVKRLLSIPNLCHNEVRMLIDNLMRLEATLTMPKFVRGFLRFGRKVEALQELSNVFTDLFKNLKKSEYYQILEKDIMGSLEKGFKERFEKMSSEDEENLRINLLSSLGVVVTEKQLLREDRKLVSIEKKIKEKNGSEILVPFQVLICPNCNVVLSTEEYKTSKKCAMCHKSIRRNKAKMVYVHGVPQPVKEVWSRNLWFEAFIGKLLRKLKWKTYLHVLVLGSSGIFHEVDILAIKKGTVLVSECKTGKVKRQDVFNFWAKVTDLKAHMGLLVLLQGLPESETRRFIEKNPMIISLEKVRELKEDQIIDKLMKRLII